MRFKNRIAIVTGAGAGIGAACATLLAREGARVALLDVDAAAGEALAGELGQDRARFLHTDVTQAAEVAEAVAQVATEFGRIDVLVNNAGGGVVAKSPDLALRVWDERIALNLSSVFYLCREAIPVMRGNGGGAIVNIGSISGLAGDIGFAVYNAAKGAVVNYTRALAIDHAAEGIRVNVVCPGLVRTSKWPLIAAHPGLVERWISGIPMQRPGEPEEIAETVAFLASPAASYVTGAVLVADGGRLAWTGQPDTIGQLG